MANALLNYEVWVLLGANSVYILRPEMHGKHSFISEASLWTQDYSGRITPDDIMFGATKISLQNMETVYII